jgi:hypothetical protein
MLLDLHEILEVHRRKGNRADYGILAVRHSGKTLGGNKKWGLASCRFRKKPNTQTGHHLQSANIMLLRFRIGGAGQARR